MNKKTAALSFIAVGFNQRATKQKLLALAKLRFGSLFFVFPTPAGWSRATASSID
ncbi:hypothetical protein [Mucilaginibacter sp. OK268]|uniref:hypothetical protein n=1 Tax=Mucilaginibacter sp. OK268 TaxID=1881048 RepID=UPI0015A19C53|nr:hypothetical protein [Mucilaginibacter sp. OK268]